MPPYPTTEEACSSSPITSPASVAGKPNQVFARRRPGNKGRRYPADPPRVEEIVAVIRQAGTDRYGRRQRGLIIVLWRAGLRISEALALTESDLEVTRGSVLVRRPEVCQVPADWRLASSPTGL
jgi:integrase